MYIYTTSARHSLSLVSGHLRASGRARNAVERRNFSLLRARARRRRIHRGCLLLAGYCSRGREVEVDTRVCVCVCVSSD